MRTAKALAALSVTTALVVGGFAGPAAADEDTSFTLTVDGTPVDEAGASDPLRLPAEPVLVELDVRNDGDEPVELRTVRIGGSVLGFTFFSFSTRIDLTVDPGETGERTFELDLFELERQASGFMQGSVELLDTDNDVVATQGFVVDPRGASTSTYSIFGAMVAVLTAVLIFMAVRGLRRGTLPANRWSRCLRFAEPGAGIGLTLVFTLSALRMLVLPASVGLGLTVAGLVAGGLFGYVATSAPEPIVATGGFIDVRGPARTDELVSEGAV
jgi:hypothetical protein